MVAPDSGSNTITVNANSSSFLAGESVAYYGVSQTCTLPNAATGNQTSQTTWSQSATPTTANSWVVGDVQEAGGNPLAAGSGTTLRTTDSGSIGFFDNNAPVSVATTLNYAQTGSPPSANWSGIIFTLAPAAVASVASKPYNWIEQWWNI